MAKPVPDEAPRVRVSDRGANQQIPSGTAAKKPHLKSECRGAGLKKALAAYVKPEVLSIDELGYLPIDKFGADCLFQIISHRYERGATLLTTNRTYKQWASIFNGDATLTSALLDRLLDHVETVLIEGKSFRGQDHAEA